ncbi:AbiH family protein [Flavobacterium caeni]|uniref:Bacteriophage abortive infection AbiH n=1 Tax=Flavobacterium caeni TaxID=490189 RepID=A0A1G5KBG8_9FLAO|nr:AbiH family protein [Flavobacterium caeni]SCY97764.1 Bacteriophage abortive infection AbiH [Flavobacterium caeni]
MQILFIIGNGFDINLGLKTGYIDFCKTYQRRKSKNPVIQALKSDIKNGVYSWADLEKRLGEYSNKLESEQDLRDIYQDILLNLGNYLQKQENRKDWTGLKHGEFYNYLCSPENSLRQKDLNAITSFKNKWAQHRWEIDIVNFNYTTTIENLFEVNPVNIRIGYHHNSAEIKLRRVMHIHGTLENMVLGVNDLSQILNEKFCKNQKITNFFIKSNNNRIQGHTIDEIFEQRILGSNLICIFGSSIGETDNIWWEKIGQHLVTSSHCQLIIFTYIANLNKRLPYLYGEAEEDMKQKFLNAAKLSEEEKKIVAEKIYVRTNTEMFSNLSPKELSFKLEKSLLE